MVEVLRAPGPLRMPRAHREQTEATSMAAGGSNMLLNSDEEEDDSDEVTFPALICFTIAM